MCGLKGGIVLRLPGLDAAAADEATCVPDHDGQSVEGPVMGRDRMRIGLILLMDGGMCPAERKSWRL